MLFSHHRQSSVLQRTLDQDTCDWHKEDGAAREPIGCTATAGCEDRQPLFVRPVKAPIFRASARPTELVG